MANGGFTKGFSQTFSPAFQQAQKAAITRAEEERKRKERTAEISRLEEVLLGGGGQPTPQQPAQPTSRIGQAQPTFDEGRPLAGAVPPAQSTGLQISPNERFAIKAGLDEFKTTGSLKDFFDTAKSAIEFRERETPAEKREGDIQAGIRKGEIEAQKQARAQEVKEAVKTKRNFKIAQGKLALTFKKFDEAVKETKRITGVSGAGRLGGLVTAGLGATGINPKVKAFEGQQIEASTAIAKIAAPSAKVGPDLISIFSKTLPSVGFFSTSTTPEAIDQTATSVTNAFINYVSTNPEEFPDGADFDVFRQQMTDMFTKMAERGGGLKEGQQTGLPKINPQQIDVMKQKGAVLFDRQKGVFVDAQGKEVR